MDKRVMIFSPERRDLEEIVLTIGDYTRKNFREYQIEIQQFSGINEPSIKGYSIGNGGEILVVFDRRICSGETRNPILRAGYEKQDFAQLSLKMSKEYCDTHGIPYIEYAGEIRNRIEERFIEKIDAVKYKIKERLDSIF